MENVIREQNNAAKFTFYYLLSLVALISLSTSVGMILFQIINKLIPDTLNPGSAIFDSSSLKFAIASIIIAGPIYYLIVWQINKNLFNGLLGRDTAVRRWLSYLILLISSLVVLGWLIGIIFGFLDGELTLKFILKAVTSVGISGIIFSYYLYDVKREKVQEIKDRAVMIYMYVSLFLVIGSLIASLIYVESPKETRQRRHDQTVTQNFDAIDNALNMYYSENKKLPSDLSVLVIEKKSLTELALKDPVSGVKFDYRVVSPKTYELCANFELRNKDQNQQYYYDVTRWPHEAGRQCLQQQIIYAPIETVPAVNAETAPVKK
ncbi:MAG: DUF5671 domain-containing protein [bacterium]